MRSEVKETARLYSLLTDKLGSDVTEAMFHYIDSKTIQSVEGTIKTLATKDDLLVMREDFHKEFVQIRKEMGEAKADNIKWMFIFWVGQMGATLATIILILKK